LDKRRQVIQAGRDFVVEATVVALRPTRPQGIRLKLQDTFVITQAASVVVPVGNGFYSHDTDIVALDDRLFADSER
jgi:D-alanine-D-alanine ligase-like ATP-grasp enzyme